MFVGKSILASFMLSTAVMVSGPNGEKIADSHISAEVLVECERPEAVDGQETAGSTDNIKESDSLKPKADETEASRENSGDEDRADDLEGTETTDTSEEFPESEETETASREEEEELAEGTVLTMLSGQGRAQMLSVVIQSENGGLVVLDGGWEADGDRLTEVIKEKGGVVDAWLITHPHADHTGALYYILKNRSDEIDINKIYYSFASAGWYEEVEPDEASVAVNLINEFENLPEEKLNGSIGRNDKITVDNLKITVLNNRYMLDVDPVNNSSIAYLVETCGKRILFLGDMAYDAGARLIRENGDSVRADIVQMAHHGQNGIGQSAYEAIAPKVCLWPTPQWLWDNDNGNGYNSGPWHTLATRRWMDTLKVKEHYCTKDGDIVLQLD